ncbi:MAG: HAD family hydrolase [Bacteroidota bacterium]|nr:HAD family hydrolase [Candidatus Kapabacteria bacterium]MDW8220732.1 HAD family hydrolase [Bacteroidota bacterium]
MPIRAITIDFWNTLYDSQGGEHRNRDRYITVMTNARRLGYDITAEQLKTAQQSAWEHFKDVWRTEHRTPSTRSLVEYIWNILNIPADRQALDEVTSAFEEGILKYPPSLLPGALEVLQQLAKHYYLALISDTAFSPGRVLRRIMEYDGIAEYFSAFSFSDETGVSKPHERAYYVALRGTNCAPSEAVHIGDIERTDIVGAKNVGMWAVLFAGDPNARMNDEHKDMPTQADARAEHWSDIPTIVQSLSL